MSELDDAIRVLRDEAAWFQQWRPYVEFSRRIEFVDRKIPSCILFNHNRAKWLREGLTLAEFGGLKRVERMRLNQLDPPDAYVFRQGKTFPVEITEVLEPGRKRGREYKNCNHPPDGDISNWRRRSESIRKALSEGIIKKTMSGKYGSDTTLLVYLNISDWGIRHRETEAEIKSILIRQHNIAKVSVIWKAKLYE